jgi:hypothetical protein
MSMNKPKKYDMNPILLICLWIAALPAAIAVGYVIGKLL